MTGRERIGKLLDEGVRDDAELARRSGVGFSRARALRQQLGVKVIHPNSITPDEAKRIQELAQEGWPASEIAASMGRKDLRTIARHAGEPLVRENAEQWRAVIAWARRNHADLFEEIRPPRTGRYYK